MAKDLFDDFVKRLNGEPVLGLCVLKGGYRFFTDLVSKLERFICFLMFSSELECLGKSLGKYKDELAPQNII